jgi:exoribonuclease R
MTILLKSGITVQKAYSTSDHFQDSINESVNVSANQVKTSKKSSKKASQKARKDAFQDQATSISNGENETMNKKKRDSQNNAKAQSKTNQNHSASKNQQRSQKSSNATNIGTLESKLSKLAIAKEYEFSDLLNSKKTLHYLEECIVTSSQAKTLLSKSDNEHSSEPSRQFKSHGNAPTNPKSSRKKDAFKNHLTFEQVEEGLSQGSLYRGQLRINKKNRYDAYCSRPGGDVFVHGVKAQNRALNGDDVAVMILTASELADAKAHFQKIKLQKAQESQARQEKINIEEQEEDLAALELPDIDSIVFGKVVHIFNSSTRQKAHPGMLSLQRPDLDTPKVFDMNSAKYFWFKPTDKRIPFILVPKETAPKEFISNPDSFGSKLVTVMIKEWDCKSTQPIGTYCGSLGMMGELPVETEAILSANGIIWHTFDDSILESLPSLVF